VTGVTAGQGSNPSRSETILTGARQRRVNVIVKPPNEKRPAVYLDRGPLVVWFNV
jgi:hypothetical protein